MVTFFGVCLCRFGKLQYVRFLFYEQDTCAISISSFLSFSRRASEHPRAIKGSMSMGRPRAMKVVGILCIQKLSRWVKVLRIKAHPSSSGGGIWHIKRLLLVGVLGITEHSRFVASWASELSSLVWWFQISTSLSRFVGVLGTQRAILDC